MNYAFPAEWARQEFVLLAFPHQYTDWSYMLDEAQECYKNIIFTILKYESVVIICQDVNEVRDYLGFDNKMYTYSEVGEASVFENELGYKAVLVEIMTNDTWCRDFGGITVFNTEKKEGERREKYVHDFSFNGWGLKYAANLDNLVTMKLFSNEDINEIFDQNYQYSSARTFILEGGSVENDGGGTILTTEQCLMSKNRSNINRNAIATRFRQYFGVDRVLWLKHGFLAGDDTDSHIDTLARFANRETILYVKCDDEFDMHYEELQLMEEELKALLTKKKEPYKLIPLPMSDPVYEDGERLPATYANFLVLNGVVLMPSYNSPKDEIAKEQIQQAFPNQIVEMVDCLPLIKQHGSLHCITMQFPK